MTYPNWAKEYKKFSKGGDCFGIKPLAKTYWELLPNRSTELTTGLVEGTRDPNWAKEYKKFSKGGDCFGIKPLAKTD